MSYVALTVCDVKPSARRHLRGPAGGVNARQKKN